MQLAKKYRPKSLDEVLNQEHLVGENGVFRKFLQKNFFPHTLLFGPAGCGKTTIARVVAKELKKDFFEFNATSIKIDEIRKTIKSYEKALFKPVLFIDEVHRLSKNQQEVLLPFLEDGSFLFLGASTQNPFYALTAAFRSRIQLFELFAIKQEKLQQYLAKIAKKENIVIEDEALKYIVQCSNGDVRAALNLLESSFIVSDDKVTKKDVEQICKKAFIQGSSESNEHYDLISAFIKSIRGSDIDAALIYLAKLIENGEPPEFIARRLAILASEDIGNANPNALNLASSTLTIVQNIGYPEARIPLSQLTIYLASSPKSNSAYKAIKKAQKLIKDGLQVQVPSHLKNYSKAYLYPHDFGGYVEQNYLEKAIKVYESSNIGFEKRLNEWLEKIKS